MNSNFIIPGANRVSVHSCIYDRMRIESYRIRIFISSWSLPQERMEYTRFHHRRYWVKFLSRLIKWLEKYQRG